MHTQTHTRTHAHTQARSERQTDAPAGSAHGGDVLINVLGDEVAAADVAPVVGVGQEAVRQVRPGLSLPHGRQPPDDRRGWERQAGKGGEVRTGRHMARRRHRGERLISEHNNNGRSGSRTHQTTLTHSLTHSRSPTHPRWWNPHRAGPGPQRSGEVPVGRVPPFGGPVSLTPAASQLAAEAAPAVAPAWRLFPRRNKTTTGRTTTITSERSRSMFYTDPIYTRNSRAY
eukprot:GHVU01055979.1.p1 GENE.GHVU01055979.1~~GHVU01055979.1.p1  ORF type:complete len:229 (-),score=10.58 GHVU01055979.1:17-703(-)